MAKQQYDIVVVGAGHNTLTAAAYLAKCGLSVLMLERNERVGGGAVSEQVTLPGFIHDTHATGTSFLQGHPMVTHDELGLLSQFGLKFAYPASSFTTVFDDGDTLAVYRDLDRTCASIAKYSEKDAGAYRELVAFMQKIGPVMGMSMARPPVSFGNFVSFIEKAPFGNDLIRAILQSAFDVIVERFEHPKVRIHFLKWAGDVMCGPEDKTTGLNMLSMIGGAHKNPTGIVVGGTQALSDSMLRAIEHHGGVVRTGVEVKRIRNQGGIAKSVELADGEIITAKKAVIAGIHPHLLGERVEGLDPSLVARARKAELSPYSELVVHAAYRERPQWKVGDEANDCLAVNLVDYTDFTTFRRLFDTLRYGEISKTYVALVAMNTNHDPTRAPNGQHTMYHMNWVPGRLAEGGIERWDDIKEQHADWMTERLSRFMSNATGSNLLARAVQSPLDHERHSPSFQGGDILGIAMYGSQLLGLRPTPELAQYSVPGAAGLYLAGPFMHPSGGISGGGRAVAIKVMEDLGVNYSKVIMS